MKRDRDALKRFRLERLGEPCDVCDIRPGSEVHHKKFRSRGGDDTTDNLMWLCLVCHGEQHGIPVKLHEV
jgi:5-methylcytosine-specific restriction endonuclease McrA